MYGRVRATGNITITEGYFRLARTRPYMDEFITREAIGCFRSYACDYFCYERDPRCYQRDRHC